MARVYTDSKCNLCGLPLSDKEEVVLVSLVKVAVGSYTDGNYKYPIENGIGKIQFQASKAKKLYHRVCYLKFGGGTP